MRGKQRNIAIIPARGGSKRIPRKNIRNFLGKPIIAYSIEAALSSGLFDEVMVSTDDEEIADIATEYGARVPFYRSERTANDYAPLAEVLLEVMDMYQQQGCFFDNVCCLLATAPFVKGDDLKTAYESFYNSTFDGSFPVVKYDYPIQRALKFEGNLIKMIWPENMDKRSQDLEPAYHDAGLFYWIKTEVLLIKKKLWTNNTTAYVIEPEKAQDIDTEEDWRLAEMKYKLLYG